MIEIIPNWHPILVHFTVSLLVIGGALQLIFWLVPNKTDRTLLIAVQKWLVIVGAVAVIATVATGLQAYYTVAHGTRSHLAMTNHRNWALATAAIFLAGAVLLFFLPNRRQWVAGGCFVTALLLVSITGFKGGELVYRHGLGVMSLPEVSDEGHEHDDHNHGDTNTVTVMPQQSSPKESAIEITSSGKEPTHDHSGHEHSTDASANDSKVQNQHEQGHDDGHHHAEQKNGFFAGLDSEAANAVEAFHTALKKGNVDLASALLDDAVIIFEGGGVERSAEQYTSHHMIADMKFLGAMNVETLEHQVKIYGNFAMSMSRAKISGSYKGKMYERESMETMMLRKQEGKWKIVHIHWSN